MEQPIGHGRGHQRGDLRAATGLAEHHHLAGVTAKGAGILAHPVESEHEVPLPGIAAIGKMAREQPVEIEIAERVQAVVYGDDDDIALHRQPRAVIERA